VIEEIAELGPFFAVQTHSPGSSTMDPWQNMSALVQDPAALSGRVLAVRGLLAAAGGQDPEAVEIRVAASVTHLGLAARLLSPALAAAVLYGLLLTPALRDIRWQPVTGGPIPMSVSLLALREPGRSGMPSTPQQLTSRLSHELLNGSLRELSEAMGPFSVSPHIMRGNTASAVNGATTMITAARPHLAKHARTITSLLLDHPLLRNAGTATAAGTFRRRSCCLIYRAAPDHRGALCGDCVLARP
jgi:hypothetical protein